MKKKVMIFDDEKDLLFICKMKLEMSGLEVHTRETCENVLDVVRAVQPDLIIMDNWIPDIGGAAAIRLLRTSPDLSRLPIIIFSANKDLQKIMEETTANACIEKPFDLTRMEKLVKEMLSLS